MQRFLIIIEEDNRNYSAYVPDLPGCVATGRSHEEVEENMRKAISMHIQGMLEEHEEIPNSHTIAQYIDVPLPHSAA